MDFWFSEKQTKNVKLSIRVDRQLYSGHSDFQRIDVFDTPEFGRVLALDIQPAAVEATNRLLAEHGLQGVGRAIVCDHRDLGHLVPPGTLDAAVFNFGWLPGADHAVHSAAESTLPALQAALDALKPGGVLTAVLYSGKVIGDGEKQAVLEFFRALPLTKYTVLVCEFANWASTAPLPCFVLKKPFQAGL